MLEEQRNEAVFGILGSLHGQSQANGGDSTTAEHTQK